MFPQQWKSANMTILVGSPEVDRMPAPWRPEPMSLSRLQRCQGWWVRLGSFESGNTPKSIKIRNRKKRSSVMYVNLCLYLYKHTWYIVSIFTSRRKKMFVQVVCQESICTCCLSFFVASPFCASEQPLVHYASATFWVWDQALALHRCDIGQPVRAPFEAWPEQRRRTAAAIRSENGDNGQTKALLRIWFCWTWVSCLGHFVVQHKPDYRHLIYPD